MRTEQQRRLSRAFEPAMQVSDVVAANGHARLAHPIAYQYVGTAHRVGGEWPGDNAGLLGALGKVVAALDDASGQRHEDSVMVTHGASFYATSFYNTITRLLPS